MSEHFQTFLDLDIYTLKRKSFFQLRQALWFVVSVIELLLVMRFLLKLFVPQPVGVLEGAAFGVSSITEYLLLPITAVFEVPVSVSPVFEWVTLLAILFYWLVLAGLLVLLQKSARMSRVEIARVSSKRKYGYL